MHEAAGEGSRQVPKPLGRKVVCDISRPNIPEYNSIDEDPIPDDGAARPNGLGAERAGHGLRAALPPAAVERSGTGIRGHAASHGTNHGAARP